MLIEYLNIKRNFQSKVFNFNLIVLMNKVIMKNYKFQILISQNRLNKLCEFMVNANHLQFQLVEPTFIVSHGKFLYGVNYGYLLHLLGYLGTPHIQLGL